MDRPVDVTAGLSRAQLEARIAELERERGEHRGTVGMVERLDLLARAEAAESAAAFARQAIRGLLGRLTDMLDETASPSQAGTPE